MAKRKPNLIIVESPTKARTISRFVGDGYVVKSSYGHVRDLPQRDLGVDVEHDFQPRYVIPLKARKVLKELRADVKKSAGVILATDEDREGEAIAWHLAEALGLEQPGADQDAGGKAGAPAVERIVFDEITQKAIQEALAHPRKVDGKLVDAQQARRVLDRLVGYKLSPLLWKKISKGLSAGRVQSVALRLIAEREAEREAFKPQAFWTVEATVAKQSGPSQASGVPETTFTAQLTKIAGRTLKKLDITDADSAGKIVEDVRGERWIVAEVGEKEIARQPLPPFTTSTLQQTASRRLGFSAKQTMVLAQQLYEGVEVGEEGSTGLITYMRTDSVHLSQESLEAAKKFLADAYGERYAEEAPHLYKTKSRLAQEAHEAIRPTDVTRTPDTLKNHLDPRQWKLYDLVWRRFLASQMPRARFAQTAVEIEAGRYVFTARGLVQTFDGYLRVYPVKTTETVLPGLQKGETLRLLEVLAKDHHTEPPPRYNEASLVKSLEEFGIGRPSTYATIMSTIQERGYVEKDPHRYFYPTEVGRAVNGLLVEHFPEIVDVQFTASMEEDLDKIASGRRSWTAVVREFYNPFAKRLATKHETIGKMVEETSEVCDKCGKPMVIRMGRFGRFLACSGFPECKNTRPLKTAEGAEGQSGEEADGVCEKCRAPLRRRRGRYGLFSGCSRYPECDYIKKSNAKLGVACPKCATGEIVVRRTRTRRTFYGCSRYPECDYATWTRPESEPAAGGPTAAGQLSDGGA